MISGEGAGKPSTILIYSEVSWGAAFFTVATNDWLSFLV
jgi:hypothetical protein